jgi:outer membrane protein
MAAGGFAQAPESLPVKIAFVDVEKAVLSIDEGKIRLKELDDWAKPRQAELQKLGADISSLQNDIATKQGVASDDTLAQLNRTLVTKKREFEDKQRDAKRDFDQKQNAVLKDLGGKLNDIVTRYADENHYTAVFILKPNDLVYLANSADITDTVIKLYNQKYPFPPPAAGPAK